MMVLTFSTIFAATVLMAGREVPQDEHGGHDA